MKFNIKKNCELQQNWNYPKGRTRGRVKQKTKIIIIHELCFIHLLLSTFSSAIAKKTGQIIKFPCDEWLHHIITGWSTLPTKARMWTIIFSLMPLWLVAMFRIDLNSIEYLISYHTWKDTSYYSLGGQNTLVHTCLSWRDGF